MARAYFRPKKGFSGKRKEAPRNGTWWIDYTGADGTRRQERTPARTETEADRYAQDAAQKAYLVKTGSALAPVRPISFNAAAQRYRETIRHLVSYPTMDAYLRRHVEPHVGKKLLSEITSADVDALAAELAVKLAPGSIEQALVRMSAVYTWARRARVYLGENPVTGAARVVVPKRAPRALTAEQLQALLRAAGPYRLLYLVAAWCGLRKGEICGLLWEDVDLVESLLHVRRSYDRHTTKSHQERIVPLPSWLAEELRQEKGRARSLWVFPSGTGKMRSRNGFRVSDRFRAALLRAGLVQSWRAACPCGFACDVPERRRVECTGCGATVMARPVSLALTFRHLRSTCATLLGNLRLAQVILGHSTPAVTARHYHATPLAVLREAVEQLPRAWDTGGTPPTPGKRSTNQKATTSL